MAKKHMTSEEKRLRRNNLIVAGILTAIAVSGILVPLLYYTGINVPK